jgi:hypothetical protein
MSQSSDVLHSIQEVPLLCKRLFGIEVDFYDMLELSPIVLRDTGFAYKPKLFKGTVSNFMLELPCDVYGIKHVCDSKPLNWYSPFMKGQETIALINYRVDQSGNKGAYNLNATNHDVIHDVTVDTYVINKNVFADPLGRLIPHQNEENKCLHFNFKELPVDVLYVALNKDEDGYLKLPEKALHALAYFMQYIGIRIKFNMKEASPDQVKLAKDECMDFIQQKET